MDRRPPDVGDCVSFFLGALVTLAALGVLVTTSGVPSGSDVRQEEIEAGVAHWTIDATTGGARVQVEDV